MFSLFLALSDDVFSFLLRVQMAKCEVRKVGSCTAVGVDLRFARTCGPGQVREGLPRHVLQEDLQHDVASTRVAERRAGPGEYMDRFRGAGERARGCDRLV